MTNSAYIVEVIRHGDPTCGVQMFGVFNDAALINPTMIEYNTYEVVSIQGFM